MRRWQVALVWCWLASVLLAPAAAHQSAVKYLGVQITPAGAAVEVALTLRVANDDLATHDAGKVDPTAWIDVRPEAATPAAGTQARCTPVTSEIARQPPDPQGQVTLTWAQIWSAACVGPAGWALDASGLFALDAGQLLTVTVTGAGATSARFVMSQQAQVIALDARPDVPPQIWLWQGIVHILLGYDHLAFVFGLLLLSAWGPVAGQWQRRGVAPQLTSVLRLVTAFTVAHSLTLLLAAYAVVSLPRREVELAIAGSIVLVALDNAARLRWPRWQGLGGWRVAMVFGLVHGLGFAGALAEWMPQGGTALELALFNVGVELGQLVAVAVGIPLLRMLQAGPRRFMWVGTLGAGGLLLAGVWWFMIRL